MVNEQTDSWNTLSNGFHFYSFSASIPEACLLAIHLNHFPILYLEITLPEHLIVLFLKYSFQRGTHKSFLLHPSLMSEVSFTLGSL